MFALKPWSETVMRVSLFTVIVFNAFAPTAAIAMPLSEEDAPSAAANDGNTAENDAGKVMPRRGGFAQTLAERGQTLIERERTLAERGVFQEGTPTAPPVETATATPTPEPSATPTLIVDSTAIAATPTSAPALDATPTASATSLAVTSQPPSLSFRLSAAPDQAAPGDEVTFTVEIANNGQTPVTGLLFSNTLPGDFGNVQSGAGSGNPSQAFNFDPQTRLLTWSGAQAGAPLSPGQTLRLVYTARMDGQRDEVQIVDSATLNADGLPAPLVAEATLLLASPQKRLTMLDSQGGKALGLNGHIEVSLPQNAVSTPRGLLIQDLSDPLAPPADQPWLKFALEMRAANAQNAQPLSAGASTTPAAPGLDTPSGLLDPLLSAIETDRIVPLEPVEAQFDQPVEIAVNFDGLADLSTLAADKTPFLVTLDEASGTWVRVPLKSIDRLTNRITAEVTHFSTWGAGIGSAFPTNGANILLFDNAYPDLFTGRARYSIPLWTPPGRSGMAPSLTLSYSSGVADGILGDVQGSWVGMGWNIDAVEVARKITTGVCGTGCGSGAYGYENKFLLLFNGTGYELIPDGTTPGRYHTKSESFLYIQLHSNNLGNNTPAASNATSEWWEVVQTDGTRWRLGWTSGSEQLAAMKGYPGAATGAWAALGYAGSATDVVASRWRADQVTDTHGNQMIYTYFEETRLVAGTATNYDRASYLSTIAYTSHTSGTPAPGYSVVFVRESRGTNDVPATTTEYDDWDSYRLGRIDVKYGTTVVRKYDLNYQVVSYSDGGMSWQTTKLVSLATTGGTTAAPFVRFAYVDKDNRAANGSASNEWAHPRLESVNNGWGGSVTFTYENDGRAYTSWYNWRTATMDVDAGPTANAMKTVFAYSTPCYNDTTAGWCNAGNTGELVGYSQTTATTKDFNGTTTLAIAVHKFHTDEQKSGREYEVQQQNAAGTILSQTNTTYTVATAGFPTGGYFTYASAADQFVRATSLDQVSRTEYVYDTTTGNLTAQKEYQGAATLYRQTNYEYVTNTSPAVWILDKVARSTLTDAGGAIQSKQEYGYDNQLPGAGGALLTKGELTLSRVVNGTQTIDAKYIYDTYGNVTETRLYKSYGSTGTQPSSTYNSYLTGYDTALQTYAVSSDPPLLPATTIGYDFGLGLPTTVTDPNGNMTTTAYDGLGRVTSIKYPGYAQPNVKYTYPTPSGSPLNVGAPFALQMEMWDESASPAVYRSAWQIMDGLGRVIQTQSPYETAGTLVLTDTSYNAQGLTLYSGLPRTVSGTGGSHFAPTWSGIPHTTASYDALGRTTSVAYPGAGSGQETYTYSGLRTTSIDRNTHQKVQESDAFGRLIKVEEYTGSSPYTLYATTNYQYDVRNLLQQVTDAAGNLTTIVYDGFERKTQMTDPDMGNWRYRYDVFGNLTAQIDARRRAVNMYYDDLNRLKGRNVTGSVNPDTYQPPADPGYGGYADKYYYDAGTNGLGRRTSMTNSNSTTAWTYNALGQATTATYTIESTNYTITTNFDAFGRPLSQTIPSQGSTESLLYAYNVMGTLSSLGNGTSMYASQIHYNASGQVADQLLGNNLIQQFCYNTNTLRLTNLRVYPGTLQACGTAVSAPRLNLSYDYEANGNVHQIVDATRSETLTFTYDALDRLDLVTGPYSHDYNYDSIGNISSKNTTTYTYGDTAHKHAVTALGTGESYGYDPNGNMVTRVEGGSTYNQSFDTYNRLVSVTVGGQTTQFLYDPDGNLVKKIKPDGSKTLYIGGVYEVDKTSGGSVTGTKTYYPVAGAMRIGSTLYFALKDHLGSASVVTDAAGTIVGEDRFYPFGETRFTTGIMQTDKLFTGQREMAGLGIYHYGARFYSPKLGRFLSADSIVPGYDNPQNLNRYSYVLNNPLRYTDPTGHKVCDGVGLNGKCDQSGIPATRGQLMSTLRRSGVKLKGNWKEENAYTVYVAVTAVGEKLARTVGGTAESAFKDTFGDTTFEWGCSDCTKLGRTVDRDTIKFRDFYGAYNDYQMLMNTNLVIHEIGHMFENTIAYRLPDGKLYKPARSSLPSYLANNREGMGTQWIWQQSSDKSSGEIFADMFVGWVQGSNYPTGMGKARRSWMNLNMPTFLDMVP